jgi:hypothetical protein
MRAFLAIIYTNNTEGGVPSLTVLNTTVEGETVWLNQKQMSELFDKNKKMMSEHIANIFEKVS